MSRRSCRKRHRADPVIRTGRGTLAGKGVYATQDFDQGDLVVPYDLKELSQAEFDDLPVAEREFTHSFWGKIYLFSEPARYVNHSDEPSTYPDLDRTGDIALRPIKAGDAITIDDRVELRHELDTFLTTYARALTDPGFGRGSPLIVTDATIWHSPSLGAKVSAARNPSPSITDVRWIVETYWYAACSYRITRGNAGGHATAVLKRLAGSWRVAHEHWSS